MPAEWVLDRRARPQGGQRLVLIIAAVASGVAGCWLTRAIDSSTPPSWILGLLVGSGLAALVLWFAMLGTRVTVDAAGQLIYSLHGRPNLAFDLRSITTIRVVHDGLVSGIGLEIADPQTVRFLHRSGVSPERMRRWRKQWGVDVVLEGFPADLAEELSRLRTAPTPGANLISH